MRSGTSDFVPPGQWLTTWFPAARPRRIC